MEKQYVEKRQEGFWISGTRISLDSVVLAFLDGLSPETIVAECFPILTLEQVYGAITYYLSHRDEVDTCLQAAEGEFENLRQSTNDPAFTRKMTEAVRRMQMSHS
jgi:uncharacterized protein (DUF433 family)